MVKTISTQQHCLLHHMQLVQVETIKVLPSPTTGGTDTLLCYGKICFIATSLSPSHPYSPLGWETQLCYGEVFSRATSLPPQPIHLPRVEYPAPGFRKDDPDRSCTDDESLDVRHVGQGCYLNYFKLFINIGVGSFMDTPSHSLKLYSACTKQQLTRRQLKISR